MLLHCLEDWAVSRLLPIRTRSFLPWRRAQQSPRVEGLGARCASAPSCLPLPRFFVPAPQNVLAADKSVQGQKGFAGEPGTHRRSRLFSWLISLGKAEGKSKNTQKVGELQRFLRDRVTVTSVDYFRMPVGVKAPIPIILRLDQI